MSLEVKEIFKKYGAKTVVDHISFTMEKPGVYALLGTNGAGKTTSIRMILGMLEKTGGEVLFDNKPFDTKEINVGYLAEERGLYPKVSLMDQMIYFANLKGMSKKDAEKRIKYWSERLELDEYFYPKPGPGRRKKVKPYRADQLSKGNQQKVQLMAALIADPKVIILDEPLSGLDPVNADLFKNVIREVASGDKYIIMSSHQMGTIEEFCTDLTILNHGKAVLQGNLKEIKKSYGRVNLVIKADADVTDIVKAEGLEIKEQTAEEMHIKLADESQAGKLLAKLVDAKVPLVRYELTEPSLHEIFVEKIEQSNAEMAVAENKTEEGSVNE